MTARIIWLGLAMAHLLLAFMVFQVKIPQMDPTEAATLNFSADSILSAFQSHLENPIVLALTGVAAVIGFLAFIIPNLIHRSIARRRTSGSPTGPLAEASPAFAPFIIRLALFENISLLGFVLGFAMPGDPRLLFPFLVAGLGLHLTQFPRDIQLGFENPGPQLPESMT